VLLPIDLIVWLVGALRLLATPGAAAFGVNWPPSQLGHGLDPALKSGGSGAEDWLGQALAVE
jgi:hypothetical protein